MTLGIKNKGGGQNHVFGSWGVLWASWAFFGRLWASPNRFRASLRTTLAAKCRQRWFGGASGRDFGRILEPEDMKKYGFLKEKLDFSANPLFRSETRSELVFASVLAARDPLWESLGARLGVLGRSWASRIRPWDVSGTRWDPSRCLPGRSKPLLERIWAPEAVPRQLESSFLRFR